jgi:heme A synthase
METGLLHLHKGFRYLILLLLIGSLFAAWNGKKNKTSYTGIYRKVPLFALILLHIQLVLGTLLYFLNAYYRIPDFMKIPELRFKALEHPLGMLLGIVFITLGYALAKRAKNANQSFNRIFYFYAIGLLLVFMSIPWPFLKAFGTWF